LSSAVREERQSPVTRSQNFTYSLAAKFSDPPCSLAAFVVNSEPHTGARPSVRLRVGLTTTAWTVLRLRRRTSAWASTCLYVRELARSFDRLDLSTLF
jgi:hypothetical protein